MALFNEIRFETGIEENNLSRTFSPYCIIYKRMFFLGIVISKKYYIKEENMNFLETKKCLSFYENCSDALKICQEYRSMKNRQYHCLALARLSF